MWKNNACFQKLLFFKALNIIDLWFLAFEENRCFSENFFRKAKYLPC